MQVLTVLAFVAVQSLFSIHSSALTPIVDEYMTNAPCSDQVKQSLPLMIKQDWQPQDFQFGEMAKVSGLAYTNLRTQKQYKLVRGETSTALFEETVEGKLISYSVWSSQKGCRAQLTDFRSSRARAREQNFYDQLAKDKITDDKTPDQMEWEIFRKEVLSKARK